MRRPTATSTNSLEMLLDTMCNTFGGVCFIALLIAILSATLPPARDNSGAEQRRETEELLELQARILAQTRDELQQAVTNQVNLLERARTNNIPDSFISPAATNASLETLERERGELEQALAKLQTKGIYSRREAARLKRLLEQLKGKLVGADTSKKRIVRTPNEHDVPGTFPVDVCLWGGQCYFLLRGGGRQATVQEEEDQIVYRLRSGAGMEVNDFFFSGMDFFRLKSRCGKFGFVRIHADLESFSQLCAFRDKLIAEGVRYNWYLYEGFPEIRFTFGSDITIQ